MPASLLAGASTSLPDGWYADEMTGECRRDTIHSMLRRRTGWNYKGPGWYMITLTLANRSRGWLGELIVGEAPASKLAGTAPSARELARECFPSPALARACFSSPELARKRLPSAIAYRGVRLANVEQLAAAAVALLKTQTI